MAVVYKCDRCGKIYERYPIGKQPQERYSDLCPDCMDDFKIFMEMVGRFGIKEAKDDDQT